MHNHKSTQSIEKSCSSVQELSIDTLIRYGCSLLKVVLIMHNVVDSIMHNHKSTQSVEKHLDPISSR
jgi:hypothetical protein